MSRDRSPLLRLALCGIFFLSGVAGLILETLWFYQAGIAFGNSVWASALVLSSFMAGLALGNAVMARWGVGVRRPVRLYALLEVAIAICGVGLVWSLPRFGGWVAPVLRPWLEAPYLLQPARLGLSFLLLLIPSTAMGMTLPLLVDALSLKDESFGSVLGRLYGWNTLGAVVGTVAGEAVLVRWLGIRGTALAAAGLDLLAAALALALAARWPTPEPAETGTKEDARPGAAGGRLLLAAALAGGILLAFEVVWFRFLKLFVYKGALSFAVMLAVVLAGIGLGGFLGGLWQKHRPLCDRHGSTLAFLAGAVSVLLYRGFAIAVAPLGTDYAIAVRGVLWLSFVLMFPVALLSGILFTWIGSGLARRLGSAVRTTGLLTLANTLGAAVGSLGAGFLLLPLLGMERSFWVLAGTYGPVALLLWRREGSLAIRIPAAASGVGFALVLLAFPAGLMERFYLALVAGRFGVPDTAVVDTLREGRTETLQLLRSPAEGEPLYHRLVTDGFSMSDTRTWARRYMKLFVYWPIALRPEARRALLVSYGVGSTAKALTDTATLERIDVVDISRDILEVSDRLFPAPASNPLDDPRVTVFIEDGRYYLQTTDRRYDLITGEPPPPLHAGIVHLYTREYFQLIFDRLAAGGINTYWVPIHKLQIADTKAIVRAYCEVFSDCSLWSGAGDNWMLAGSRPVARRGVEEQGFVGQWRDPTVAGELRALGLEVPELLGTTFISDARHLRAVTRDVAPLVDDFPKRLGGLAYLPIDRIVASYGEHLAWMDPQSAAARFRDSEFIRRAWPAGLRDRTLAFFPLQALINRSEGGLGEEPKPDLRSLPALHGLLTRTHLRTLPLWVLGVNEDYLARRRNWFVRVAEALADRDYGRAARAAAGDDSTEAALFRIYALGMAGDRERARALLRDFRDGKATGIRREVTSWLSSVLGLEVSETQETAPGVDPGPEDGNR